MPNFSAYGYFQKINVHPLLYFKKRKNKNKIVNIYKLDGSDECETLINNSKTNEQLKMYFQKAYIYIWIKLLLLQKIKKSCQNLLT